jgi:hypothetical protein
MNKYPRMPGQANADTIVGHPDEFLVRHQVAICVTSPLSKLGYTT